MLSHNFPMRKCASGPVGGPSATFKVGLSQGQRQGGAAPKRRGRPGYLPTPQGAEKGQETIAHDQENCPISNVGQRLGGNGAGPGQTGQQHDNGDACSLQASAGFCKPVPEAWNRSRPASIAGSRMSTGRRESSSSRQRREGLHNVMNELANERVALQSEREQKSLRRSRRLSSAGSMASCTTGYSSSYWSTPSQAVRSTILDLELQLERERREAAEEELAALRAKLADGKTGDS